MFCEGLHMTIANKRVIVSCMSLCRTLALVCIGWLILTGCEKKQPPPTPEQTAKQPDSGVLVPNENAAATGSRPGALVLPVGFGKMTGDLDEMLKQRSIRALVIANPIGFFYHEGEPQGIQFEALQEFEKFVNQKEKTGKLPIKVIFLPMRPDQL